MQTLENFLGPQLWLFVSSKPAVADQLKTLWQNLDWAKPETFHSQLLEIQSFVASLMVPVEKKLAKTKEESAKSQSNTNSTSTEAENLDSKAQKLEIEDLQNLSLRPIFVKGVKVPNPIESQAQVLTMQLAISQDPQFKVITKTQKTERISPKPPFITSSLQQAASSLLGLNPKITMQLAQRLYEGIEINGKLTGLITYMRTDSFALSSESITKCRDFLSANYPEFLPAKPNFYKSKKSAQEAHEAIRPTNPLLTPQSIKNQLEPRMWRVYELIWRQTLSCQMTDQIRERVSFELENSQKTRFAGSTAWTTSLGWKVLFEKEDKN